MPNSPRPSVLAAFAALLLVSFASAQRDDELPKWRIDPYTKNDPEAIAKAGYVGFGPFQFGTLADRPVTTTEIDDALEYVQILWIETPHFRIGTNLPAWKVPVDLPTRTKLRAELAELAEKLPRVNEKAKVLDPWLRAHLTAHRLEKLYKETQELFGVTDADFPQDPAKVVITPGARYMGYGPYMGMKEKFLVLVFEKQAPYLQYMKRFLGRDTKHPQRWHFTTINALLIAFATESNEFPRKHDTALHCALAFNVSQNLLDGFRFYAYDLPVWIREGFGHWNCRRVDPNWNNFDQNEGAIADMKTETKWEKYCRNMVRSRDKFAPFAEAYQWRDFGDIKFDDHVAVWSRVDWMMSQGPEKWREFLFAIKGRVNPTDWSPDQEDLVGAMRDAIQAAYGVSVLSFDDKWIEWVEANYPLQ